MGRCPHTGENGQKGWSQGRGGGSGFAGPHPVLPQRRAEQVSGPTWTIRSRSGPISRWSLNWWPQRRPGRRATEGLTALGKLEPLGFGVEFPNQWLKSLALIKQRAGATRT